jgi:hypothetical protein
MTPTPVRVCPLCGSTKIAVAEPDTEQAAAGVTCILNCECGAVITLAVRQGKDEQETKKG